MQRAKNASRNIVFGIILKAYQIAFPFVIRTAMIYKMGMNYVGLNSLFTSVLQVLNLAELGVGSAMVYSMYKPIVTGDEDTICALLNLYKKYYRIIGCIVLAAGIILLPFIPHLISKDSVIPEDINIYLIYLMNLFATVMSYWLFAYMNSLLMAHQRNDLVSKVMLVTNTIQYALQLVFIIFVKSYYLYLSALIFTQILTNILTAVIARRKYPNYLPKGELEKEKVLEINHRVRDLFTAKFGTVVVSSADSIVISAFLGLSVLGIYNNYYYIVMSVSGFLTIIFNSITSGVGNSLVTESLDKNYKDFKMMSLLIVWLLAVCSSCFLCLFQPFMTMWVGKKNLLDFKLVILFCIYFFVCQMSMLWATFKDAAGLWHEDRYRALIGALANLILNIILVQFIGLYGILLSTIISYVCISIPWLIHNLFSLLFKRSSGEYLKKMGKYILVMVFVCILSLLICKFVGGSSIMHILLRLMIAFIVPNIFFILFFRKSMEFDSAISLIKRILKRNK